jgi:peptidoglycan L-alanyl-D-glutamate endopeptidase CwlK
MGLRTIAEQDALYAQGRTTPGKIVTNAPGGSSFHNFGLAVDLVEDGDANNAGIQWSWANNVNYLKIGDLATQVGLEWGGFWKSMKDYPHVQLTTGLTISDANALYHLGGLPKVWERVDARLGTS